ncbi:MAG: phage/plasmid replication protein, partial [Methylotenera sp.]|nr:phage/plasmid replication protein [Methylotenera sp.]
NQTQNDDFFKGEVMCDWLCFRHDFDFGKQTKAIASGKTIKLNQDGTTEWEKQDFTQIKCSSSDTSIRVKCDGAHLWFQGNIGRFQQSNNVTGLTVLQCFEKASDLLRGLYPELDLRLLGSIQRKGTISQYGTVLTRLDLNSNFTTDSYLQLSQVLSTRKIGQKIPRVGLYGPTWGYDTKRGQYWKAKLYDKTAEQDGKRTPYIHATTARFEVQLGSEYLRQNDLNTLSHWGDDMKTENIIYGKFAHQVLNEQATIEDWSEYPAHLRQHAVLWRDGSNPKSYLSTAQYYKVRKSLLERGLDISSPCNVMTLTHKIKTITLSYAPTLRRAA